MSATIHILFAAEATGATGEATAETEAHEEGHHGHNSFYGNKNELIWGSAAFLIILVLFVKKGVPLIKKASAARTQRIADEIAAGEAAKAAAQTELGQLKTSLGNASVDAEAIRAEGRARAATLKSELIARADADIAAAAQRARVEIEASRQQAFADLQAEVASMTITATQAVVTENLTANVQNDLIEQFITQLGATR